jgi:hypothetical protein
VNRHILEFRKSLCGTRRRSLGALTARWYLHWGRLPSSEHRQECLCHPTRRIEAKTEGCPAEQPLLQRQRANQNQRPKLPRRPSTLLKRPLLRQGKAALHERQRQGQRRKTGCRAKEPGATFGPQRKRTQGAAPLRRRRRKQVALRRRGGCEGNGKARIVAA